MASLDNPSRVRTDTLPLDEREGVMASSVVKAAWRIGEFAGQALAALIILGMLFYAGKASCLNDIERCRVDVAKIRAAWPH